jgi:hypothetical protein
MAQSPPPSAAGRDPRAAAVVVDQNGVDEFSIDLWNKIAERLQSNALPDRAGRAGALDDVRDGKAMSGWQPSPSPARGLPMTSRINPQCRPESWCVAGQDTDSNPLMDLLGCCSPKTILLWLGIALLLILPAHII